MQQILHQHETQASTEHKSVNDVIAESGIVQTHEEEISGTYLIFESFPSVKRCQKWNNMSC